MATFDVVSVFPKNVNSDSLFPAIGGDDNAVFASESDHFAIRYTAGPLKGLIVTFISSADNIVYNGAIPSSGTFDEIRLASGTGVLDGIANWSGFPATSITNFNSNALNNLLVGTDTLNGGAGNDTLRGNGGGDTYVGKGGNDVFVIGSGDSTIHIHGSAADGSGGGQELDTIKLLGSAILAAAQITNIDALTFAGANDSTAKILTTDLGGLSATLAVRGNAVFNEIDFVTPSSGSPLDINLSAFTFTQWTNGVDVVKIEGGDIGDTIVGSRVGDTILANDGADLLSGGLGKDFLTGGAGEDTFDFNRIADSSKGGAHRDVIMDFEHGTDHIDVSNIDGKSKAGLQHFKFIGTQHFHHKQGELHYTAVDADTVILSGDRNGDGKADFQVEVNGVSALGADDFFFTQGT
jgi:Ca2+-binding RTX toxin-like protein